MEKIIQGLKSESDAGGLLVHDPTERGQACRVQDLQGPLSLHNFKPQRPTMLRTDPTSQDQHTQNAEKGSKYFLTLLIPSINQQVMNVHIVTAATIIYTMSFHISKVALRCKEKASADDCRLQLWICSKT